MANKYTHFNGVSVTDAAYGIAFGKKGSEVQLFKSSSTTSAYAATNMYIQYGAVASTTGSNFITTSSYTQTAFFGAEDGGAAIGSGVHVAAGRFRYLMTYTGGNREQEVSAVRGQLVSKSGTNRHNMCAVLGSYEVNTGLTVGGQLWTTDPWIQAGVMGRVGAGTAITTIDTYGVLAALAAMSATASFAANNGTYTGLFIGKWAGNADFPYGIVIDPAAVGTGIYMPGGATGLASTILKAGSWTETAGGQADGSGMPLTGVRSNVIDVTGDTGGTNLNGAYYVSVIRANLVHGTADSNSSEITILGTLNNNTAAFGSGDKYALRGHVDLWGNTSLTGANVNVGAVSAYLENEATTTVDTGNVLCGLQAYQVTNAPTLSGTAINPALWIRASTGGAAKWQYGIYMDTNSVKSGITIGISGAPVTTATSGTNWIYVDAEHTIATAGTVTRAGFFRNYYNGTTNASTTMGLSGVAGVKAGVTWPGSNASYIYGVQGQVDLPSTAELNNSGSCIIAGVRGVITGAHTQTGAAATEIFALFGENLNTTDMSGAAHYALLGLRNDVNTAGLKSIMLINPGNGGATAFIDFTQTTGTMYVAGGSNANWVGGLTVQRAGVNIGYIPILTGS